MIWLLSLLKKPWYGTRGMVLQLAYTWDHADRNPWVSEQIGCPPRSSRTRKFFFLYFFLYLLFIATSIECRLCPGLQIRIRISQKLDPDPYFKKVESGSVWKKLLDPDLNMKIQNPFESNSP